LTLTQFNYNFNTTKSSKLFFMKNLLYIVVMVLISGLWSCEKKSKWEKAADSIEDAAEEVGEAAEESAEATEEETEKAGKKINKLFK